HDLRVGQGLLRGCLFLVPQFLKFIVPLAQSSDLSPQSKQFSGIAVQTVVLRLGGSELIFGILESPAQSSDLLTQSGWLLLKSLRCGPGVRRVANFVDSGADSDRKCGRDRNFLDCSHGKGFGCSDGSGGGDGGSGKGSSGNGPGESRRRGLDRVRGNRSGNR